MITHQMVAHTRHQIAVLETALDAAEEGRWMDCRALVAKAVQYRGTLWLQLVSCVEGAIRDSRQAEDDAARGIQEARDLLTWSRGALRLCHVTG